jgi:hypothetical protein
MKKNTSMDMYPLLKLDDSYMGLSFYPGYARSLEKVVSPPRIFAWLAEKNVYPFNSAIK